MLEFEFLDVFSDFSSFVFVPVLLLSALALIIYGLYLILRNPFKYPYFVYKFDVTSKRNVRVEDHIDNFLRNNNNWQLVASHQLHILQWKNDMKKHLQSCLFKNYRTQQYQKILDDKQAYHFQLIRKQTRYRQKNYIKRSYKINVVDSEWAVSWQWIEKRYEKLKAIGFEATLNDYSSKKQRNLMTPQLRRTIMERDNYTCQICGKYMPDEIGLHIDHITPIAKGGKSVTSNLRVLCSKCNGKKGAK